VTVAQKIFAFTDHATTYRNFSKLITAVAGALQQKSIHFNHKDKSVHICCYTSRKHSWPARTRPMHHQELNKNTASSLPDRRGTGQRSTSTCWRMSSAPV